MLEPGFGEFQRFDVEPAPTLAAALLAGHESGAFQCAEVLMNRRERHVERFRQLAECRFALRQMLEHRASTPIGEASEDGVEILLRLKHLLKC